MEEVRAGSFPVRDRPDVWSNPLHDAPDDPCYTCERSDRRTLRRLDTGEGYYRGIDRLKGFGPVWPQYARSAPIFAYNTNAFDEPTPPSCQTYAILASGLLGFRLVLDSDPPEDAHLILYDINPDQLAWAEFVLANAGDCVIFDQLLAEFRHRHRDITVRPVLEHEVENVRMQVRWYAKHRRSLERTVVQTDIMTDPSASFGVLRGADRTFMMFLDIFMVWPVQGSRTVVRDLSGLARSCESKIREIVDDEVIFAPGDGSQAFQLQATSPFREA